MRTGGSDPNQHHVSLLFVMTGGEMIWWEVVRGEMIWGEVVPIKILERQRR